jgi:fructan beta-fructosidase
MFTNNFLFYLVVLSCWGCTGNTNFTRGASQTGHLHLRLAGSAADEPMAFLQYKGLYNIYHASPREPGTDKGFTIARTTSYDLINWTKKQTSFLPGMRSSFLRGGIIIDSTNATGYGTSESPAIVAVLTRALPRDSPGRGSKNVTPLLAFSKDGGDSWTVDTNDVNLPIPLLENPQQITIVWFSPASKWIMTVALNDHVEFFSSTNLRTWAFESKLGAEFFPEDVRWNRTTLFLSPDNKTWVLLADIKKTGSTRTSGGTVYFVGDFDGHQFVNRSSQLHWLDYGEDVYGSLMSIANDGRRINLGWKNSNEHLTAGSKQRAGMTMLPRELTLDNANGEFFIRVSPPRELNTLHAKQVNLSAATVSYKAINQELVSGLTIPMEMYLTFKTTDIQKGSFPTRVGLSLWNNQGEHLAFGFDRFGFYYLDTSGLRASAENPLLNTLVKMPYDHTDSIMDLHILLDSSTIECYAEGGKLVMTSSYSSIEPFNSLKLFALNGDIEFLGGKVIELDTNKKP